MRRKINDNGQAGVRELDRDELPRVEGGVVAVYDAEGNVITCTDPRRWMFPRIPLSSKPPLFGW